MDVAPHVVVCGRAHVGVNPNPEVSVGQRLGALVDQDIVVEGHVVDLVVGGESKGLRSDFHPNGLALRLRVNVPFVVENPVEIAVTVEWHQVFTLAVLAINL